MSATGDHAGERLVGRGELLLLVATVVVTRLLFVAAFPIYDDAFITYRYARNLVATGALVYNPGADWEPVLGTTAPGYGLLLAGLHALGPGLVAVSLAVNVVCDGISAWLLVRLLDRRLVPATLCVLGFAGLPHLARVSTGGMEAPVLVALALGAAEARRRERPLVSGVLAALCCSFRPESVLLVAILGASYLRRPRALVRYVVPVALIGLVHAGSLIAIYGSPVPQSVAAKAARHVVVDPLSRIADVLSSAFAPEPAMWLGLPLALFGLARVKKRAPALGPFVLFALAIVAAYVAARPKTWGWYYYAPQCAWVLGLALGLDALTARLARLRRARGLVPIAALVVVAGVVGFRVWRPDRVTAGVYEPIERWARDDRVVERGARILASDIGAFGWYADTRILDSQGLVWPAAVEHTNQIDLALAHAPEYVVLVVNRARMAPYYASAAARRLYRPKLRFNATGASELEPDLDGLPDGWVQDYLLLERIEPGARDDRSAEESER